MQILKGIALRNSKYSQYRLILLPLVVLGLLGGSASAQPLITTVIGGGNGDGSIAINATLNPSGITYDSADNLYIVDTAGHRVRRVDGQTGIITTIAGTGVRAIGGEGTLAIETPLSTPSAVAIAPDGAILIGELDAYRIRRVDPQTGLIKTIAGTGVPGYSGDGGPATAAQLAFPTGLASDPQGNVYIADQSNDAIRRISPSGIITTIAGTGVAGSSGDGGPAVQAQLASPFDVAVAPNGSLFIADLFNQQVRRIDLNGIITTVAGTGATGYRGDNGPATSATLYNPLRTAVDEIGNVYIADSGNHVVRVVDPAGIIHTYAGTGLPGESGDGGLAAQARFDSPQGLAIDSLGDLTIGDSFGNRVRRVKNSTGIVTAFVGGGNGDGSPAIGALLDPRGLALDSGGNLVIADMGGKRVRQMQNLTTIMSTIAGTGVSGFAGDGGPATQALLNAPINVAVDSLDNVFFTDIFNGRVRRVDKRTGIISSVIANLSSPFGLAFDAAGNLYVSESGAHRVRMLGVQGSLTTVAGTGTAGFSGDGGSATTANLSGPRNLFVASNGDLYINDFGNKRVRRVRSGIITTVAGNGLGLYAGDGGLATLASLAGAEGLFADSATLYIADASARRVRQVDLATGIITTLAGNGSPGTGGDNGPALDAQLTTPAGLAMDSLGNLYVGDIGTRRVRLISLDSGSTPVPTATPSATNTPAPASTLTPTPSPTPTKTVTATPTPTSTSPFTATPTQTPTKTAARTATPTWTPTGTATRAATPTWTPTRTATPTWTPLLTSTPTRIPSATATKTSAPPTATSTPIPGDTVWVDDSLPAGAVPAGDAFLWVSTNPLPFTGASDLQSQLAAGIHQQYFTNATTTLTLNTGDSLVAYVYIDPINPPQTLMLQWYDGSWEHRAYWGKNLILWGVDGTASRLYMGPLPAAGQWVRLMVPASQVNLEGHTLNGMAFTLYDGRASCDHIGSEASGGAGSVPTSTPTWTPTRTATSSQSGPTATPTSTPQGGSADTVWIEDSLPAGSISAGDALLWVGTNPTRFSGALALQSQLSADIHQQYFYGATTTLAIGSGDTLVAYVYLDPANAPRTLMLQWNDGSWEHRAYWGENLIPWGVDGTASRLYMGPLPAVGQWVRLSVPASQVSLAGSTLNGMAFTLYGGRATWDHVGRATSGGTAPTNTPTPTATPTRGTSSGTEAVWIEDTLPSGSVPAGDPFVWAGSNPVPYSGSLELQSSLAGGIHQQYFYGAAETLSVASTDALSAYVYLDPANPPRTLMLQWNDGSWEHRAYWGENLIPWGVDGTASRRYMGPLPSVGLWVHVTVPASQVDLGANPINGMAFTLYDGHAGFDHIGIIMP